MKKKILLILLRLFILIAILEFILRCFLSTLTFNAADIIGRNDCDASWRLYWMQQHKNNSAVIYYGFDDYNSTKGWSIKSNLINMPIFNESILNSNSKGIRGNKEYEYGKSANKRILILGDSFTFGDEVSDDETYAHYLQSMLPFFEVINFGVHGYGHDQMLIYFKEEGVKYKPDIVILGFFVQDMDRNILKFRDYSKPKFELINGKLKLKNYPVPRPEEFLKNEPRRLKIIDLLSMVYQKYRAITKAKQKEVEEITTAIISEMVKEVRQVGAIPVLVYLPMASEMKDFNIKIRKGETFLANYCANHGVYYLSLRTIFAGENKNGIKFGGFRHYQPKEHQVIAESIKEYLENKNIIAK